MKSRVDTTFLKKKNKIYYPNSQNLETNLRCPFNLQKYTASDVVADSSNRFIGEFSPLFD